MVMKITEMFYTLRNRVRQSGESVPDFVSFSGSSGVKIPFSAGRIYQLGGDVTNSPGCAILDGT
jgi:hypothetical protein